MTLLFGGARIFRRGWLARGIRKMIDIDERYGLFTVVAPLAAICYATVYVGCIAMDRQKELRWLRMQSISKRQHDLEEEHETLRKMLNLTDDDYEFIPPPASPPS